MRVLARLAEVRTMVKILYGMQSNTVEDTICVLAHILFLNVCVQD